ncbi:hypothetical protein PG987_002073 [Apiospora arundinis]
MLGMKNPFCLTAVYKTVDGGDLEADIRVPYAKEGHPLWREMPTTALNQSLRPAAFLDLLTLTLNPQVIDIPSEAGLGVSYSIINKKHSEDLVHARRYVVVSPEYRPLDPSAAAAAGSSVLLPPIQDCRDLLAWIYDGGLQRTLEAEHPGLYPVDYDRIYASGMSYGGLLALSLGWDVPRTVAGILSVGGPCWFDDGLWAEANEAAATLSQQAKHSDPISLGLEPASSHSSIFDVRIPTPPALELNECDPAMNVHNDFPRVFLVHGTDDKLVPIESARHLLGTLQVKSIQCDMAEIEGTGHLFASTVRDSPEALKQVSRGVDWVTSSQ